MGWSTSKENGKSLYYSDEGLDLSTEFLSNLRKVYEASELNRLPTLQEILFYIQTVLGADLQAYCADGNNLQLQSISAKTVRISPRRKAIVGDIIAVPLKRDLYGFIQVLSLVGPERAVVGLFPHISSGHTGASSLAPKEFLTQARVQLTGIGWKHWDIIGNLPLPSRLKITEAKVNAPCFVAELGFVDALKKAGLLPEEFRLYANIPAMHPKLQPEFVEMLTVIMQFLDEKKVLSESGKKEIKKGRVENDFSLTSDLLTEEGRRFYPLVFEKGFMDDYFFSDTRKKIAALWKEFKTGEK